MALARLRNASWLQAAATWRWLALDIVRVRRNVRRARQTPDEFDLAYGVQTRVAPPLREMYRTTRRGGFEHEPTSPGWFREILDALDVDFESTVFVDYGSGAGRAVLLAAEYPFKEVVGIELAPSLHARAEMNLRAAPSEMRRAGAIRLVRGDAAGYTLSSDPAVLYFYNPFGPAIMRRVLANIEASLAQHRRPITIILAHCYRAPRQVAEASPRFRLVSADRGFLVFRSV
jgi:hypothetical protein